MPGRLTRLHTLNVTGAEGRPRPRLKPRGIPPALAPHGVYATDDPLEASRYGRDLFGSHRIQVAGNRRSDFEATLHAVLLRDITLGHLDYGTEVSVEIPELTDDHLVIVPANGVCEVTTDDRTIVATPVTAIVPAPNAAMVLEIGPQSALVLLRIARSAMDVHLSRLLGRTLDHPLVFEPELDLSSGSASRWNFAVQMLHAELFDPGSLLHRGVGIGQLEEFLMSSLLYTQASTFSDELSDPHRHERRSVRSAREFIEANLARPMTVEEIAIAADVSVRTLQSVFNEDLQQTPTAYIRNRRLERVRADLADAPGGTGVTVTEIASRWGFNHLGRFATTYHARFGETPSQTLRS